MRSRISWGKVYHWRGVPREHEFTYPMLTLTLDVDELSQLPIAKLIFSQGRGSILSVRPTDYLAAAEIPEGLSLRERVEAFLARSDEARRPARITLVTMPRYFGYVFNPVSFFYCFDEHDKLFALVTQVNNTFGETHIYPLRCTPRDLPVEWKFSKEFFVSPFFSRDGEYTLRADAVDDRLLVSVALQQEGRRVFFGALQGEYKPLTSGRLLITLLRFPITILLTMPRIHLQAVVLYLKAKVLVFIKPPPDHTATIRSKQSFVHRVRLGFLRVLKRLRESVLA